MMNAALRLVEFQINIIYDQYSTHLETHTYTVVISFLHACVVDKLTSTVHSVFMLVMEPYSCSLALFLDFFRGFVQLKCGKKLFLIHKQKKNPGLCIYVLYISMC